MEALQTESLLERLGALLAYPDGDFPARVAACRRAIDAAAPEVKVALESFEAYARKCERHELEELYTRTFDMNPDCSLDIGWHLHGEQYERGAFLVAMREHMRRLAVPENHELPDHLSHVLVVLARMEPVAARRFTEESLKPALRKILEGFKDESNPYRLVLKAIEDALPDTESVSAGESND
ncbi:MAG TPA: nitrate reductase molybdenum cofactor assembly chaperone [Elusimicrobia bacterium]|nr:MAG: nitrate reductase molybdenum cofactor assembly chaperone [Elusimicrobia bacterium GWA2_66_18]OGR72746.1 MAG: nitrate reductase molybdenum cofactor assembly chaperone [Elusimicrobia bacterium GWC2_65_9]HAZ08730.1 nitrate reductase molybdenum cofactor assembly chaperone [Elusimicrobiota bacterium]